MEIVTNAPPERQRIGEGLADLSRAASLSSATALLLSVIYNYAYFRALQLESLSVLSIADVIRSALMWLVPAAIPQVIGYGVGLLARKNDNSPPFSIRRKSDRAFVVLGAVGVIGGYLSGAEGDYGYLYPLALLYVVWMPTRLNWRYPPMNLFVMILPLLILFAYERGTGAAWANLRQVNASYAIKLRGSDVDLGIIPFRFLDAGLLYRVPNDKHLVITPWTEVLSLHGPAVQAPSQSRLCSVLHICPGPTPVLP